VLLTTQYLDEADRLADRIAVIDRGTVIAEGTSAELKRQVGGDRLEIVLVDPAGSEAAAAALAPVADGSPTVVDGVVRVPVRSRSGAIADAIRRLDAARVAVDDIALRTPTLDDVFLELTGHAAESEESEQ
jgi:ABC-2 type transport system ATP-binding protein